MLVTEITLGQSHPDGLDVPHFETSDLHWAAGVFEASGRIRIRRQKRKDSSLCNHVLLIEVCSPNDEVIFRLQSLFQTGNVSRDTSRASARWQWQLSTRQAEYVLSVLEPYTQFMIEEIGLARKYLSLKLGHTDKGIPMSIVKAREEIAVALENLVQARKVGGEEKLSRLRDVKKPLSKYNKRKKSEQRLKQKEGRLVQGDSCPI